MATHSNCKTVEEAPGRTRTPAGVVRLALTRVGRPAFTRAGRLALTAFAVCVFASVALGDQLRMTDGKLIDVDEAWEDAQGVWYRRGGVTHWVERSRVKEVVKGAGGASKGARSNSRRG